MNQSIDFLRLFNHKVFTLCYYNHKVMRSFPCTASKLESAIKFLQNKNTAHEIYFMVNEGNGVLNDSRTACHSTNNVIQLSSIFLDAELSDNSDPLPNIKKFSDSIDCPPSTVVYTSPNRYHVYWLLEPTEVTPENILKWQQIQSFLHSKFSSDKSMTDIPQILRIPGFKNIKKLYPIHYTSTLTPLYYSLDTIYDTLKSHFPEITKFKQHQPLQPITENFMISEGERHEELLRRARKAYTQGLNDTEVKCLMHGVLMNHVTDYKIFLNGGSRAPEFQKILASAKSYHEKDLQSQSQQIISKHTSKKSSNPFELEPDFYYNAPGIVGELTRYFVDSSNNPIPAHAFAAASALVGFTKARFVQGINQLPPTNYFLCLAPSGSGKTTIQHLCKNVLSKLKISHLTEDDIASGQGLIQFLHNSNGLGLIFHDEVRSLFQIMHSRNVASHELRIPTELTKLYTAYKSIYTPATTKTHKGKKIILEKPLLSFMGFGQHTLIDDRLFTKENVTAGLLPRFIILAVNSSHEHKSVNISLPSHILDELHENVTKSNIALEEKSLNTSIPLDTQPIIKTLSLNTEAQSLYDSFSKEVLALRDSAISDRTGLEALFSRGREQSLRLALSMSTNQITYDEMVFSIKLIDAQMNNFNQLFTEKVSTTENAKDIDRLYDKIIDMVQANNNSPISRRELQKSTYRLYKITGLFTKHLNELIEQGKITEFEKQSDKSNQKIKLIGLSSAL